MISKDEWERKIAEYKNSGMTQAAWCRSQGIAKGTLQYHVAKRKSNPRFVELTPPPKGIKIHWKQISFEIDPDFDVDTLSRFLQALS